MSLSSLAAFDGRPPTIRALPVAVLCIVGSVDAGADLGEARSLDGEAVVISVADSEAREGRELEFPVTLSDEYGLPVEIRWRVVAGTAVGGVDFHAAHAEGTLHIPAQTTEAAIRIRTLSDIVPEPDDTLTLALVDASPDASEGLELSETSSTAVGTILDNDGGLFMPDSQLREAVNSALGRPGYAEITEVDLAGLTVVSGVAVRDLRGLEFATGLKSLTLASSPVPNLSPIGHLAALERLDAEVSVAERNRLPDWDMSRLSGLRNLTELVLSGCPVLNIAPLADMTGLVRLHLPHVLATDLEPLANLTGLEDLDLSGNVVADLGFLAALTNLKSLTLDGNNFSNLSPLQELASLERLSLHNNSVSDVEPLAALSGLKRLHLGGNNVTDISPLLEAGVLADDGQLYVHDNPLDDVSANAHVATLRGRGVSVYDIGVWVGDAVAAEGRPLVFTTFLSRPAREPVEVPWRTSTPLAEDDDLDALSYRRTSADTVDYASAYGVATIPAGATQARFSVETNRDEVEEKHEIVWVTVSDPDLGWSPGGAPFPQGVTMASQRGIILGTGMILEPESPTQRISFVESASHESRRSFLRAVNRFPHRQNLIRIEAIDGAGRRRGPLTLNLHSNFAVNFNSTDLERGNPGKRLFGETGAGQGDWRLELQSNDLEVLSYLRAGDGFLTSMHDTVPLAHGGHFVPIFNPASNFNQMSRLRLVNGNDREVSVKITGIDDLGERPGGSVRLRIPAGETRTLSASDLERGTGVSGRIGDGTGKWRLIVEPDEPMQVMSLLESPTGHLSNLSTSAEPESSDGESTFRVPLFPSASDAQGREGFVRIVNRGSYTATVRVSARDDSGWSYDPITLSLDAGRAVQLNSHDLESGNPRKGLPDGMGPGEGNWRLELTTAQDIHVGAYIRTRDGFLTSMHDVVPPVGDDYFVPMFNPAHNTRQVSLLRLINPHSRGARVRIRATDDWGARRGDTVELRVPANSARTVSAQALEQGLDGLTGRTGRGYGKWRLTVSSSRSIQVMNLLESPTGHLTNLSTRPGR
ncbi:MAG: hypothetical protein F4149_15780 [Gammaproteobacteria bacterium]|nr:hypothetical protein [Gammaproteobacteria bacterium]MYK84147.1 hypothetical protein [Gammaproteobacteria bacterium]